MAIAGGTRNISWLYSGTLIGTLLALPAYYWLAARTPRRVFIPVTYLFIGGSMTGFFVAFSQTTGDVNVWVSRVFFVWASVFNMFLFTLFWAFMADFWSSEQAKRVFGLVGIGGTAGVLGGSFLVGRFAEQLGLPVLVTVFAVAIGLSIIVVLRLSALSDRSSGRQGMDRSLVARDAEPTRDIWAGYKSIVRSPYLIGISFSVIGHTVIGTFLWIMRTKLAAEHFGDDREARIAFFANITLYANLITIVIQLVLFRVISKQLGIGLMLALVPIVAFVGFGLIEILPSFGFAAIWVVFWVQTLRRGLHYAISKPAREILFTVVSADERYKSKPFIDTFVYRGGDWFGAQVEKLIALSSVAIGAVAIPIAGVWLVINLLLGCQQVRLAKAQRESEGPGPNLRPKDGAVGV